LSFSGAVERPSGKFPGGLERVELDAGIPLRSTVYLEGRTAAETEFRAGTPLVERLDLDLDGRLETIRRYGPGGVLLLSESDWDGDGIYEYAENPAEGRMRKSWDLDRDGIRETEEP
ncbi:MAG: hypothetical protein LBD09_01310, partial [Treponema sp.]|nr:hypothetical protein [Treponema sp.]